MICKGIQSIGLPCKSIMTLPAHPEDVTGDLIRTDSENLSRSEWWKDIGASKVVLYSWAHPKYTRIAEAVRDSGAKVLINLDSSGIISPIVTPELHQDAVIGRQIRLHGRFLGTLAGSIRNVAHHFYAPIVREPGRVAHLRTATAIGCISSPSLVLWRLWARTYAPELVERMHLVPNPVSDYLKYDPMVAKQDIVMAVGRWDDEEPKRPTLLANAIAEVAKRRDMTEFHIYGNLGRVLPVWYNSLTSELRKRVHLHGKVSHQEIREGFMRSRIGLCSSSHEGSHVSSAEVLCAGASIVAPFRKELNAMIWYVSHDSGQLSVEDSALGLAETLVSELEAWDRVERNPVTISSYWCSLLTTSAVVDRIRELLD